MRVATLGKALGIVIAACALGGCGGVEYLWACATRKPRAADPAPVPVESAFTVTVESGSPGSVADGLRAGFDMATFSESVGLVVFRLDATAFPVRQQLVSFDAWQSAVQGLPYSLGPVVVEILDADLLDHYRAGLVPASALLEAPGTPVGSLSTEAGLGARSLPIGGEVSPGGTVLLRLRLELALHAYPPGKEAYLASFATGPDGPAPRLLVQDAPASPGDGFGNDFDGSLACP